ncbi:MAG: hypothetical protein FJ206_02030 [Gemmatimonadetes bacterium]|nr:hypothetical protein [Gemmatimonadota bacterium]
MRGGSIILLAVAACGRADPGPPTRLVALPAPELREAAFEPHLAIDPDDPDRILVAAQYGLSRNRGGRKIWTWHTDDGGRTWQGAEQPLPGGPRSTMAADAVTAFTQRGEALMAFLFADSATFQGGLALTRSGPGNLILGPARVVARDDLDQGGGAIDKGWLAVDRWPISPRRGTVYLTWHRNRPLPGRRVETAAMVAASNDGGRTWRDPRILGAWTGVQVVTRPTGEYTVVGIDPPERLLVALSSGSGGTEMSTVDTIAAAPPGWTVDLPSAAVTRSDRLVVCWSEIGPADSTRLRCGRGDGRSPWQVGDVATGVARAGLPALAAAGDDVWLAALLATPDSVALGLFRSVDDGGSFTLAQKLAARPFRRDLLCLASAAPCRRTPPDRVYFPGDYLGATATPNRVVVAFPMPEGTHPNVQSVIHVAIIRP